MSGFPRSKFGPYAGHDVGDHARTRYVATLARKIGLWPGDRALDVECGHGTVAVSLARAFTKGKIVATDRNAANALRTRENARKENVQSRLEVVRADPAHLPFKTEAFMASTLALALRDLKPRDGPFAEMHRVTFYTGKLLVVEVDYTNSRATLGKAERGAPKALDDKLLAMLRDIGWGKLGIQRVDLLADGSTLELLTGKRYDPDEEEPDA